MACCAVGSLEHQYGAEAFFHQPCAYHDACCSCFSGVTRCRHDACRGLFQMGSRPGIEDRMRWGPAALAAAAYIARAFRATPRPLQLLQSCQNDSNLCFYSIIKLTESFALPMIAGLDPEAPVSAMLEQIAQHSGIAPERQELLSGFPPKPLDLSDPSIPLSSSAVTNGDTMTVRESAAAVAAAAAAAAAAAPVPSSPASTLGMDTAAGEAAAAPGIALNDKAVFVFSCDVDGGFDRPNPIRSLLVRVPWCAAAPPSPPNTVTASLHALRKVHTYSFRNT